MLIEIYLVMGSTANHIEARLPNGERVPFKSLRTWNRQASLAIKAHLSEVYKYDPKEIKFNCR
jgi:hypothetical protein